MKKEQSAVIAVALVILMSLSPFFCCFLKAAEPTELELVKQAAERDFPRFLKAAWQRKEDYGFQTVDKIEAVKLAKPIRVYGIDEEIVKKMKDVHSLVLAVEFVGEWIFPVEVSGEYRTLFGVRMHDKGWKGDYLGNPYLAHTFQELRQAWSDNGEDTFRLVSCIDPRSFFFIATSVAEPNLTPLTRVGLGEKEGLAPPENLSSWMPASKVISELKRFWAKGLHWGPFGGLESPKN